MSAWLFFVEDPGALNVIAPVVAQLPPHAGAHLLSSGHAAALLQQMQLNSIVVDKAADAVAFARNVDAAVVIVGTSENAHSPGLALIEEGRASGRVTIGIVDFSANAGFRFCGDTNDPLAYAPDWLLVPDAWTATEYESLGFPAARIQVVGHPHYDAVLKAKSKLQRTGRTAIRERAVPGAGDRSVLVFVSEISTGLNPEQYRRSPDYTLTGRGGANGRTEIVIEEVLDAITQLSGAERAPYLVLRRHPKETDTDLAPYLGSFDFVSRGGDPLELIYAADLVVGMSSMLLMEAHLLGVPTLSVLPRVCELDWLPITRSGAIPAVTDRETLRRELRRLLAAGDTKAGPQDMEIMPGAASRIVAFVQQHSTPESRIST